MNKKTCPICHSENISLVDYLNIKCIVCKDCGYDERKQYEVYPEEKTSQKEKMKFNTYKTGGAKRTFKKL